MKAMEPNRSMEQSETNMEPVGRMAFEQQPREGAKAIAAFRTYLELGPERSLATVAEKHGKSQTKIERWSRRFDRAGCAAG